MVPENELASFIALAMAADGKPRFSLEVFTYLEEAATMAPRILADLRTVQASNVALRNALAGLYNAAARGTVYQPLLGALKVAEKAVTDPDPGAPIREALATKDAAIARLSGLGGSIAKAILSNLQDRKGFDHWWDGIDEDIQAEIEGALARIASEALDPKAVA